MRVQERGREGEWARDTGKGERERGEGNKAYLLPDAHSIFDRSLWFG